MASKLVCITWSPCQNEYIKDFVCDTDADFSSLPKCTTGSCAISISSGEIKMVNTDGEWVAFGG